MVRDNPYHIEFVIVLTQYGMDTIFNTRVFVLFQYGMDNEPYHIEVVIVYVILQFYFVLIQNGTGLLLRR